MRSLSHARIAATTSLLIVFFGTISVLVRALSHDAFGAATGFLTGLIVTPIIASPVEWLVHRYVYHRSFVLSRRIYAVHLAHHHLYFPTWRYVTGGPARRIPILGKRLSVPQISRWKNGITYIAHFGFYMTLGAALIWLPAWLLAHSVPFLVGSVLATIVISNLFIVVHDAIHRPGSHRLLETQAWFCFLDEHHYIHHVDTEANVNFLLPLADWLFGTLRRDLTTEELARHGPRKAAKSHVSGAGEPALPSTSINRASITLA
ncbi:MAG TPA: hypothetical protein VJ124_21365 [Pyrinomonadaceae bacterium]|nr:hypothetical protein [Pyrinomonadaceae bacterium]